VFSQDVTQQATTLLQTPIRGQITEVQKVIPGLSAGQAMFVVFGLMVGANLLTRKAADVVSTLSRRARRR